MELFNSSPVIIDIEGWTISDNNGSHAITTGAGLFVPSGGYVLLARSSVTATNGGVTADYSYGGSLSLSNSGDNIDLTDDSGAAITSLVWSTGVVAVGATAILNGNVLAGPFTAADAVDIATNWCTSTTAWTGSTGDAGSPGLANEACP